MSLKIEINLDDTYDYTETRRDQSEMTFSSPQRDGSFSIIQVGIEEYLALGMPNVYNLGFGPPNGNGGIIDHVPLKHLDNDKVFSTILLFALKFLRRNPETIIGLDGSDDKRTILYHLMFKRNKNYLDQILTAMGVDWYIRVFRDWTYDADAEGNFISRPRPETFDYNRPRHDLYRYYMFHLK